MRWVLCTGRSSHEMGVEATLKKSNKTVISHKEEGKKYKNATTTEFWQWSTAAMEARAPNKLVCNRMDGIFQVEEMVM
nr:hypothetical protein CFP56_21487 [Quercus suber]